MLKRNLKSLIKKALLPILSFIGIFLIWEFSIILFRVPEYFIPRPSAIIYKIFTNFDFFIKHASITAMEAALGFLIAAILSFAMATVFVHSKIIKKTFYPLAISLKTIPIIAIAPLLVLWIGIGITSKIAIVILTCFFPMLINMIKGLETIDQEQLDLFKSLLATRWQIFIKLRVPNSLSYILPALRTSAIIAVLGAIVGEFVGANAGIGYIILFSTYSFNTLTTFAAITMSSLIGLLFFGLISLLEKKILFWQKSD